MNTHHQKWRPGPGTATGRVWEIADELRDRLGRMPRGPEVAKIYLQENGNLNTCNTQFSAWKKSQAVTSAQEIQADEEEQDGDSPPDWLAISSEGRLVIPPALRQAMRLDPSGMVMAEVVEGELRLRSPTVALEQARAIIRAHDKGTGSAVDELIRDRRREAEEE